MNKSVQKVHNRLAYPLQYMRNGAYSVPNWVAWPQSLLPMYVELVLLGSPH